VPHRWLPFIPIVALLLGCDSGNPHGAALPAKTSAASASVKAAAAAVTSGAAAATAPAAAAPTHANSGDIEWHGSLDWHTYSEGVALAKQDHKPILLMVYADWCSKCRALVPVFQRDDVRKLVDKMVAVRQDQDDPAPWLSEIAAGDNYVPRIMFLNSDGTPIRKVTSGHPRYPFFYMADQPETLLTSLKQALAI
jgi:protein-disulfide reductase (glutathione)